MSGISVVTGEVRDRGNVVPSRSNPTANRGSNKTKASPARLTRKPTERANKQVKKAVEQISLEYIEGSVEIVPTPHFKAKSLYRIHGVGEPFEGIYYTKKVTHKIGGDGYTVSAEVFQVEQIAVPKPTNTRKPQVNF